MLSVSFVFPTGDKWAAGGFTFEFGVLYHVSSSNKNSMRVKPTIWLNKYNIDADWSIESSVDSTDAEHDGMWCHLSMINRYYTMRYKHHWR